MRRLVWITMMAWFAVACGNDDSDADASGGTSLATTTTSTAAGAASTPATSTTTLPARSGEIVALSYNVAGLPEILSGSRPAEFTPQIGPLLNDYELVLLQESWRTPEPNPLAPLRVYHEILEGASEHTHRSEPEPLPLGSDPARPAALVSDGLNRFSDVPFDRVQRAAWSECFGGADESDGGAGDCLSQKGFSVAATTLDDGVVVDVYNLHLEAGGTEEDQRISRGQAEQLAAFIAEHSAGRPVIVGGDFNLHTDPEQADDPDEAWDLESFRIILAEAGLTDVCEALDCPEPGRIDKFLFRSSDELTIEPLDWRVETDVFVSADGEPLSDHDAVAARFAWSA
jgi:hypothetical protein